MGRTTKARHLGVALAIVLPLAWGVGFAPTAEVRRAIALKT
jgi:hypothetical protein